MIWQVDIDTYSPLFRQLRRLVGCYLYVILSDNDVVLLVNDVDLSNFCVDLSDVIKSSCKIILLLSEWHEVDKTFLKIYSLSNEFDKST